MNLHHQNPHSLSCFPRFLGCPFLSLLYPACQNLSEVHWRINRIAQGRFTIAVCTSFFLFASLSFYSFISGYLEKRSSGNIDMTQWKRRFFVLTDHLRWYTDEEEFLQSPSSFHGLINLSCFFAAAIHNSNNSHSTSPLASTQTHNVDPFQFIVYTYPKSLVVKAESEEEMSAWIEAFGRMGR